MVAGYLGDICLDDEYNLTGELCGVCIWVGNWQVATVLQMVELEYHFYNEGTAGIILS